MTNATLTAFRNIAETINETGLDVMTAREMALIPHSLGRTGDKAIVTTTGEVWFWSKVRELWVR
jgi:hypothetical protein